MGEKIHYEWSWWNLNEKVNGIFLLKTLNVLQSPEVHFLVHKMLDYRSFRGVRPPGPLAALRWAPDPPHPNFLSTSYYRKLWNPCKSLTNFITLCGIDDTTSWERYKLTMFVVIGTDWIGTGSCKSNYHRSQPWQPPYKREEHSALQMGWKYSNIYIFNVFCQFNHTVFLYNTKK